MVVYNSIFLQNSTVIHFYLTKHVYLLQHFNANINAFYANDLVYCFKQFNRYLKPLNGFYINVQ